MACRITIVEAKTSVQNNNVGALQPLSCTSTCAPAFTLASQTGGRSGGPGIRRLGKHKQRTTVLAHGILDAYRKDKGLLERQREAFRQSNEARQPPAEEADDEVCPSECVKEIKTGLQYYSQQD